MNRKPLVILTGPTAVGKTGLSVRIAREIGAEIISADSMQVYKYMDIGSAKVTPEEMGGVPHHLIDCFMPDEDFNVVRFKQEADRAITDIHARGRIPMLVGGTGFYIQAVLRDIDFTETVEDGEFRREMAEYARVHGNSALHEMLREKDPEAAAQIHENNVRKIIRALEFARSTGARISDHNAAEREKESPYNFAYFVLERDRQVLYDRIDRRVDVMMQDGLLEEVTRLRDMGYTPELPSMQGLGYKQLLKYLAGEYTLDQAVTAIKTETRHYAKKQITWFKREKDVIYLDADRCTEDELSENIKKILISLQII